MTAIQFSIGALNDIVDAPFDSGRARGRVGGKPLADGLIGAGQAWAVVLVSAAGGFGLASLSGVPTLALAVAGAACGYAYDLRLSRTVWAWLPLALALPLVPVFAWAGSTGGVPGALLALTPVAMLAGGGLAIGNALADLEADLAAGTSSVAVRLGRGATWRLQTLVLGASVAVAFIILPSEPPAVAMAGLLGGSGLLAAGAGALAATAGPDRVAAARLGWGIEAIGVALLGTGWALALVGRAGGAS